MTHESVNAIFAALRRHPEGLYSRVAAAELNWSLSRTSNALGKLAMYGVIDRVAAPERTSNAYRYSLKQREERA